MSEGIRKRGNRHQAYFRINGTQFSETFDTQAEAKQWRAQQVATAGKDGWIAPGQGRIRLDHWCDRWLNTRVATLSRGSWRRYETIVRLHIAPALGHWNLEQLDRGKIQQWVNQSEAGPAHQHLPVLRAALTAAVRDGRMTRNPASDIDMPTYMGRRMTFLEPDELADVLTLEDREWARDVILGLAFTGARFGELAAVTPSHVNLLHRTIDLYATKTKQWRTLTIPVPLLDVVERRLHEGNGRVWTSPRGGPLSNTNFRTRVWYPLMAAAGNEEVRVHDLRHTCASWLIRSGASPVAVAAWLGHAKPTQTLNTYAHLFRADMADMASALERMWEAPGVSGVTSLEVTA